MRRRRRSVRSETRKTRRRASIAEGVEGHIPRSTIRRQPFGNSVGGLAVDVVVLTDSDAADHQIGIRQSTLRAMGSSNRRPVTSLGNCAWGFKSGGGFSRYHHAPAPSASSPRPPWARLVRTHTRRTSRVCWRCGCPALPAFDEASGSARSNPPRRVLTQEPRREGVCYPFQHGVPASTPPAVARSPRECKMVQEGNGGSLGVRHEESQDHS
jgi:hypothetical protein